ncbi:MAG: ribose-phosphate pyrophosphokinase [Cellulosilyticum sp.]|nr:ribose-phosphate pyrophosphokinase [Cellulosilyticum sp.]
MIKINGEEIHKENFPDGTLLLKYAPQGTEIKIYRKFENNEELITLYYLTRSLQEKGYGDIELIMPYIPNARQDRIKKEEDIFTLKYFSEIINTLNFKKVYVLDPHSDVSSALIHRIEKMPVTPYIEKAVNLSGISVDKDVIFYPDNGSQKRYSELFTFPNAFGIKTRDWVTGEIKGLEVAGSIPNESFDVLIIDDISSYGGTFYFSALKLKELGARKIYLYITHCENSILKGKLLAGDLIEHIYTTNSLFTSQHEKITVFEI